MKLIGKLFLGLVLVIGLAVSAVFYFTSGLVDEADRFFAALREGKTTEAYDMLSTAFKEAATQEQFVAFLAQSGLNETSETSWHNRQVNMGEGSLEGTATTQSGSTLPVEISFVQEDGDWKILGIHKRKTGLSDDSTPNTSFVLNLPEESEQIQLVQQAMNAFGQSVNAKNMQSFHQHISELWRKQYTVQKLDDAFKSFYEVPGDLTKISNLPPVFPKPAVLEENGVMKIAGFFPTKPQQVNFEQKYVREGTQWKLLGFHIFLSNPAA